MSMTNLKNELRHSFLFPCPSILGLLVWLTSFPFLFVWGSRREKSFPRKCQVWAGKAEVLRSCCSGLEISQGAHGNTGLSLAQPDQFVPWLFG